MLILPLAAPSEGTTVSYPKKIQLSTAQMESFIESANSSDCLNRLERNEDMAVAVSRQYARASARKIFCFGKSNNIRNFSVALLMRANRVQIPEWNQLILRAMQAGLIGKWSSDQGIHVAEEERVIGTALGIDHFYGGLSFCILFLFAAIFAFIFEVIVHRKLQRENRHRFWRTADWVIDGQRHLLKLYSQVIRNLCV